MTSRTPEGGPGHMVAHLGNRSPITSSISFPSASPAPASNTPVPTQGQHGSALPDLARGPAHAPRFGGASSPPGTGFSTGLAATRGIPTAGSLSGDSSFAPRKAVPATHVKSSNDPLNILGGYAQTTSGEDTPAKAAFPNGGNDLLSIFSTPAKEQDSARGPSELSQDPAARTGAAKEPVIITTPSPTFQEALGVGSRVCMRDARAVRARAFECESE